MEKIRELLETINEHENGKADPSLVIYRAIAEAILYLDERLKKVESVENLEERLKVLEGYGL